MAAISKKQLGGKAPFHPGNAPIVGYRPTLDLNDDDFVDNLQESLHKECGNPIRLTPDGISGSNADMSAPRVCLAMSFDSNMFVQAQECLATIRKHAPLPIDVCVLTVNLSTEQTSWLTANKVTVSSDLTGIQFYSEAPPYAYSQTCRPILRELFPGYDVYMWVDADIRFAHRDAFDFYLHNALTARDSIVINQEVDTAYGFVRDPKSTTIFHRVKNDRLRSVYGDEMANLLAFSSCYNTGIFAMHRDSKIWPLYLENVRKACDTAFHHMKEQDAMNVAITQSGVLVCSAPTIMNWLCSIAAPGYANDLKRWVRPEFPYLPISVLHLTNSKKEAVPGQTFYDLYKQRGMT